jgi:hypothetical protein
MSVVQVQLPDDVLARAREIAAERKLTVERVIADAVQRLVEAREGMDELNRRAQRGRDVNLKAILAKSPDVAPTESDGFEKF